VAALPPTRRGAAALADVRAHGGGKRFACVVLFLDDLRIVLKDVGQPGRVSTSFQRWSALRLSGLGGLFAERNRVDVVFPAGAVANGCGNRGVYRAARRRDSAANLGCP